LTVSLREAVMCSLSATSASTTDAISERTIGSRDPMSGPTMSVFSDPKSAARVRGYFMYMSWRAMRLRARMLATFLALIVILSSDEAWASAAGDGVTGGSGVCRVVVISSAPEPSASGLSSSSWPEEGDVVEVLLAGAGPAREDLGIRMTGA
jgi:hypothetical protein